MICCRINSNYKTQDKDAPNVTSAYHSLGHETENRNPLHTQSLVLPYSDRNHARTIQHRAEGLAGNSVDSDQENSPQREQEVDHRFESEESVHQGKNSEQEEMKVKIYCLSLVLGSCTFSNSKYA